MLFETSLLQQQGGGRRVCAIVLSAAGQTLIAGSLVLLSIVHTDFIAVPKLTAMIGVPVSKGRPIQQRTPSTRPVRVPGLTPFTIPVLTYPSVKAQQLADYLEGAPDVPGFEHTGSIVGGLPLAGLLPQTAVPPAQKAEVENKVAAKPPEGPPQRIAVSTGVQSAKLIHQVRPVYPQLARTARIQGVVRLTAIIGVDGAIQNLRVEDGHPLLTPSAVEAVKQWRYQPTMLNGQPVEVITQIQVVFTLS